MKNLDEHRFYMRMYTRICEENGPADPVLHCLATGGFARSLGGDRGRRANNASMAADNLRSFVRDGACSIGQMAVL
jgi:hypothetical protein